MHARTVSLVFAAFAALAATSLSAGLGACKPKTDDVLVGAYLSLSNRPALQSELNLVIEANAADNHPSLLSLRGTVVYSEAAPEKYKTGIGVLFVEDEERGRTRD